MALRVDAFAAVFSDAGVGIDGAGISRLPALDARGIAGIAVSAASARIGDAMSVYEEGIISHVNATAQRLGARAGEPLKPRLAGLGSASRLSKASRPLQHAAVELPRVLRQRAPRDWRRRYIMCPPR